MPLIHIYKREKYLKPNGLIKLVLMSITEDYPAAKFHKYWVKQPNFLAKWHIAKIQPPDVETEYVNDRIDYLTKNLNNYRKFSQIFNCDFSYLKLFSKLKLQYFNCDSLTKSIQDCLPHLTVCPGSNYERIKINFGVLNKFYNIFLPIIWRLY